MKLCQEVINDLLSAAELLSLLAKHEVVNDWERSHAYHKVHCIEGYSDEKVMEVEITAVCAKPKIL